MKNIMTYIKKYGDLTFQEKKVNDIDILIFSLIPYIDFKDLFFKKSKLKLSNAWDSVKEYNTKPFGFAQKTAFDVMKILCTQKRYKDLILRNYVYHLAPDTQFGAITIEIPNVCVYVAFEGTDDALDGWKEDFKLTYVYPTDSQNMASRYLNDIIRKTDLDVVVCGHSKGGNLALVGSMNINFFRKQRIKKIYSFDGPGLRKKQFKSFNYRVLRNKLVNIIPNLSLVGILLKQENLVVVKSRGIGLLQHDPSTWVIDNDTFKYDVQGNLSKKMKISINRWLSKYNDEQRKEIVEGVFDIFEKADIKKLTDIKSNKLNSIYRIVKASKNISLETKEVIITSFKLLATDFKEELKKKETQI